MLQQKLSRLHGANYRYNHILTGTQQTILADDPEPRRIVIGSFNKLSAIMRRVSSYDRTGAEINELRKTMRGASLKNTDVLYFRGLVEPIRFWGEGKAIFNALAEHSKTRPWGFVTYEGMTANKYKGANTEKRTQHQREEGVLEFEVQPFQKNMTDTTRVSELMRRVHHELLPLMRDSVRMGN